MLFALMRLKNKLNAWIKIKERAGKNKNVSKPMERTKKENIAKLVG